MHFFAHAQHVQCAPQMNFLYRIVMPLSSCANVPSLVSLAQKFTNSEDPRFKKVYPSGTCCLCRSSSVTTKDRAHHWWVSAHQVFPQSAHWLDLQPWTQMLNIKGSKFLCTCPARAMCTPGQLFMWRCDAPVPLCQCAKFGVASSKIHKLGGSHV